MKLAWNSLLISLGLLLSPSVVLAESLPTTSTENTVVIPEAATEDYSLEELEVNSEDAEISEEDSVETARQQKLIEADALYMSGQFSAAAQRYREAKEPFTQEVIAEAEQKSEAIYNPENLAPAGAVYWRHATAGLEQGLESKIFIPLQFLVERHPEFIPGHIRYAEALKRYNRPAEAVKVLERAVNLYPQEAELLQAKIETYGEQKQWLEASLAARQFALLNPQHPEAETFIKLAETSMERYQRHLRGEMRGNAIANIITGALGYAVTGGLLGPLSAIDSTALLLQGESGVGSRLSQQVQNQLPLLEDETVLEYVREIGTKLTHVTGRDDFEYEFHVIMDDRLNAFALPGGKIFINAGAILKTNSEAELAGLLAHELAHTVLSHGFQLVTQGNLMANIAQYIPYGGTAANLIVLNYNREMEREADAYGTRILAASGYAADGLRNLMVTLDKQERSTPFIWLATHPSTDERVQNIERQIIQEGYNRYAYEGVSRHTEMKQRVNVLWEEYQETEEYRLRYRRR